MNYGFVKVATAIPHLQVANCDYNEKQIESLVLQAEGKGAEIICLPELSLCGYTCADLFGQQLLLDSCEETLFRLLDITRSLRIITIVGMPVRADGLLFNAAVAIQGGKVIGIVPKTYLPNYKEFYEKRWFAPAAALASNECHLCGQTVPIGTQLLFHSTSCCFAIELCEDLWAPIPPSCQHALAGAEIIFNLSA
ncbi:MAG: NAD(+) synthase, partial [Bacteroidaceae bacterium]|nr:NAD(+) synthase [Bacteroidaceae bacterium]